MHLATPLFVKLILPLATGTTFTYSIPEELRAQAQLGRRVTVQFGRGQKIYSAIIAGFVEKGTKGVQTKPILSVVDDEAIVFPIQLEFWQRLATHYLCSLGEVMIGAIPSQLLLDSETRITPLPYTDQRASLPEKEQTALAILDQRHVLSLDEIGSLMNLKNPLKKVKRWVELGVVTVEERVRNRFTAKTKELVVLQEAYKNEAALNRVFDELARAPKQTHVLMSFIQLAAPLEETPRNVERTRLLKASTATNAVLLQLVNKGILDVIKIDDSPAPADATFSLPTLSNAQEKAYAQVVAGFKDKAVCLLQGITSSGKTELYLKFIEEQVSSGKQLLYLLPEIALTTQMIKRISARMGDGVRVFHSRLTHRERAQIWQDMVKYPDRIKLVIAARSGLFLPFKSLGGIIVDEEHDPSYKQQDPAPRYQARDMAIVLALMHQAKVILGSATPSIESLFNAKQGKYAYVTLTERFGQVQLPSIETANIREAQKKHQMKGRFSPQLVAAIHDRLLKKEQVILFQNRRGYTPIWQCTDCGWIPECDHCDVSLTFHKREHGLRCHYCGRLYEPVTQCRACDSKKLKMIGFGTEMLEEELASLFPQAQIARLDQDSTRRKHAYGKIMADLADGSIDILVGTQMVTKGLDLEHVTLVGIMNADSLIRFPEFRAEERAFQLMSQVAGRAGRRNKLGSVIIQTYDPQQAVLELVRANDVEGMYERELNERQQFLYPPFSRLIKLTFKHRDQQKTEQASRAVYKALQQHFGTRAIGPETPYVSRIRDQHIRNILLKLSRKHYFKEKNFTMSKLTTTMALEKFRAVRIVIDVDAN